MIKCKVCDLQYGTDEAYELHRIAHILKDIDSKIKVMNDYFKISVDATVEALKASTT